MEFHVPILLILMTILQFLIGVHSLEDYHEHANEFIAQDHRENVFIKNDTSKKLPESMMNTILKITKSFNVSESENISKGISRKAKFNPDESDRDLSNLDIEDTTYKIDVSTNTLNTGHSDNSEHETTIHPTTKKAKQLEIYKTRPNELLRHYVEDTNIRPPFAALVDKKLNPLMKARQLWRSALRPKAALDAMLVSYDSEGNNCDFLMELSVS
jgi:hypothetical protein